VYLKDQIEDCCWKSKRPGNDMGKALVLEEERHEVLSLSSSAVGGAKNAGLKVENHRTKRMGTDLAQAMIEIAIEDNKIALPDDEFAILYLVSTTSGVNINQFKIIMPL